MTKPKYSDIVCVGCGRVVGRVPGENAPNGVLCDDPLCNYQPTPGPNQVRDSVIVASVLDKGKVMTVARLAGISRQRTYQILDTWKAGGA